MNVIEASSGTYRSRVDGTIVLSVEIEPRFRAEALTLFGMPGTPMALAALRIAKPKLEKVEGGGIGHWCWQAVATCREQTFWEWIRFASLQGKAPSNEAEAAEIVKHVCGIETRSELDTNLKARETFQCKFLTPYKDWLRSDAVIEQA